MISLYTEQALRGRLQAGEQITLKTEVKAAVGPGHWTVASATIPGSDPASGEIIYSCHLDHERPGANDNASGCVTILESTGVIIRARPLVVQMTAVDDFSKIGRAHG